MMTFTLKFPRALLFLFLQILLFLHTPIFACEKAFESMGPKKLKDRLLSIAQNKKELIQSLEIEMCGPRCLFFRSQKGLEFQMKEDPSLTEPEVTIFPSSKILTIPSLKRLKDSFLDHHLMRWLVGHEIHPYTGPSKIIQYTKAQKTALTAFKKALSENARSFLHIGPTNAGKTLVLAQALKEKLQNHATGKISFVTADQIHLVDQLFTAIQGELKEMNVAIINWNDKPNKTFYLEIEKAIHNRQATVFVITTQSLKSQLSFLWRNKSEIHDQMVELTDAIYIDEAHHLGAYDTRLALLTLQRQSKALLYGTTATPVHHQINLRELFEREHWSYLNTKEGKLFEPHPPEKVIEQLSIGIERGEITPFEDLYIIGESKKFNITTEQPLFIPQKNGIRVLNPHHYNSLAGTLFPVFQSNKKGFIVTATIAEAHRLTDFLNESVEGARFEAYHSQMSLKERKRVLQNSEEMSSHYIVAVKALDEGVNLPHLSAYIDLNINVSVKQMVHRIGRVLRLHPGKTGADILFLADYRNQEMAKDLLQLLDLVRASPFHKGIKYNRTSADSGLAIPKALSLTRNELRALREELEQSAKSFWGNKGYEKPPLDELTEVLKKHNLMSQDQWANFREKHSEFQRWPKKINKIAYPKWKGWRHLRGEIPIVKGKNKPSYEELIEVLIRKNITSQPQWEKEREKDKELQRFPKKIVNKTYPEWKGWRDFLNKPPIIRGQDKPSLEELINTLIRKNITSGIQWKEQWETDPKLQRFPKEISKVIYPKWKGWRHLRKEIEKRRPTFKELTEMVIRKNITSGTQWKEQWETDPELRHIPKDLHYHYPGWSWREIQKLSGQSKPSYTELINILIRKNITSGTQWKEQWEIDPELQDFPTQIKRDNYPEWNGWKHFREEILKAKEEKPAYKELIETLIKKNITSSTQWEEQWETDPELQRFLKTLKYAYPGQWKGWRHFNRELKALRNKDNKTSYKELIKILKRKGITSGTQWEEQWETDPELRRFPQKITKRNYPEWKGWRHLQGKPSPLTGKNRPPFEELIQTLKRKGITSRTQWEEQWETDPELQKWPKKITKATYPEWKGWRHFRSVSKKE